MNFMSSAGTSDADRGSGGYFRGLARGVVRNIDDPDDLGRVEVQLENHDDGQCTIWAQVMTPMAGDKRGFYCLPEEGDAVCVGFVAEDPAQPVVLGGLWDAGQLPPDNNADRTNDRRLWRTRAGHELRFDDGDANEIELKLAAGPRVYLAKGKAILEDGQGNKVEIDGGSITIETRAEIRLKAATVSIEATGAAKLTAVGTCKVKGATVEIN